MWFVRSIFIEILTCTCSDRSVFRIQSLPIYRFIETSPIPIVWSMLWSPTSRSPSKGELRPHPLELDDWGYGESNSKELTSLVKVSMCDFRVRISYINGCGRNKRSSCDSSICKDFPDLRFIKSTWHAQAHPPLSVSLLAISFWSVYQIGMNHQSFLSFSSIGPRQQPSLVNKHVF